ncbi:MAG: DUF4157 domain-containing protein [Oscillatoria sp. SIO1A7]|nr:DUF4157 domain-containing protein [Oscillatoria sp. SIO1A7]
MPAKPEFEAEVNSARGGGRQLDQAFRAKAEPVFGADFSGVRVHADARSDALSRSIQAMAFTTGQDMFFRQGAYQPGTSGGQELLAHELTHVKQQREGGLGKRQIPIQRRFEIEWNDEGKINEATYKREPGKGLMKKEGKHGTADMHKRGYELQVKGKNVDEAIQLIW